VTGSERGCSRPTLEVALVITVWLSGSVSDGEDAQHIYENVGEAVQGDDDAGWGSSEFEDYDDDRRSVGAHSQNSQSSVDRAKAKAKNLLRRVPARLSWGKPGSDLQSVVGWH